VAVPTVLGTAGVELLLLVSRSVWHTEWSIWPFLLLRVYIVAYQSVLWTMSSLRPLRLLGVLAIFFIMGPPILLYRTRNLMVLIAFLAVPLARIGVSATAFARNRQSSIRKQMSRVPMVVALIVKVSPSLQARFYAHISLILRRTHSHRR
jgi:hypothetical protein